MVLILLWHAYSSETLVSWNIQIFPYYCIDIGFVIGELIGVFTGATV